MGERAGSPDEHEPVIAEESLPDRDGVQLPVTTAADVESAGRSCLVILILLAAIVLLVLVWVVYRAAGGGQ